MSTNATIFEDGKHQFFLHTLSRSGTPVFYTINATSAMDALEAFFKDPEFASLYVNSIYNLHTGTTHFFGMSSFRWRFHQFGRIPDTNEAAMDTYWTLLSACDKLRVMSPNVLRNDMLAANASILEVLQLSGALHAWCTRHQIANEPSPSTPTTAP